MAPKSAYQFGGGVRCGQFDPSPAAEDEIDRRLSDAMVRYWTNFAATGDPNGAGLPPWPRYDGQGEEYLERGDEISAKAQLHRAELDVLEGQATLA